MKKTIAVILLLCLCVSMVGCASKEEKEAAQNVMAMIDDIGTVTLDSEKEIDAALEAYNNLTDKARELVTNYAVLEQARSEMAEVFTRELNAVTDMLDDLDDAINAYDMVKVVTMIDEIMPIAEKLQASKYYTNEEDLVGILNEGLEVVELACYPNSRIISLDSYIKLDDVYNATADSNEGENCSVDSDTGMEYHTYFYNSTTAMANAFLAYNDYLELYFERTDVTSEGDSATYFYKDEEGRAFYAEWAYYNLGSYGSFNVVYVGFDPAFGLKAALGK